MLSHRYTQAVDYAREAHGSQVRKGSALPYIHHPLAVSSLVLEYGGDEDQAIAALLHDVVEDCGAFHEEQIRRQFGPRVARMVMACTDGTRESKAAATTPELKRADWQHRKHAYLAALRDEPDEVLLVSGCDKLHNARAIAADLRRPDVGASVFARFTGGREGTLWYYGELARIFSARSQPMAPALTEAVAAMGGERIAHG